MPSAWLLVDGKGPARRPFRKSSTGLAPDARRLHDEIIRLLSGAD
jgi:hypothetical protein